MDSNTTTNDSKKSGGDDDDNKKKAGAAASANTATAASATAKKPKRIIRRRRNKLDANKKDDDITIDANLFEKVMTESCLPKAYQFEIEKSCRRILELRASHIALQMPEGLLMYACAIGDVLKRICSTSTANYSGLRQVSVLGDVTYGACCVDDLTAKALGCQLLIHYGHSCLVPIQHTCLPCLYVFVEVDYNVSHMVQCLHATLLQQQQQQQEEEEAQQEGSAAAAAAVAAASDSSSGETKPNTTTKPTNSKFPPHVYIMGTVQFRHCFVEAKQMLLSKEYGYQSVSIPQVKPLSPGEVLGCTTPVLTEHLNANNKKDGSADDDCQSQNEAAVVLFVADGRFHLESTLIANEMNGIRAYYRYDPYSQKLTEEKYDHSQMKQLRFSSTTVNKVHASTYFGIILGTLGRQGNPAIVRRIQTVLNKHKKRHFLVLMSEISPAKLKLIGQNSHVVDVWVQVACPRLSIDWGHCFDVDRPVLSPYELMMCLEQTDGQNLLQSKAYPMDYYSYSGGPWSNYYNDNKNREL